MPSGTVRIDGKRYPGESFFVVVPAETKRLDLHDKLLLDVDFDAIGTLHSLEDLDLSGNDFHGVHVDLRKLEGCPLRRIDLQGDITMASTEPCVYELTLGKFPHLELLDLYQNALTTLDLAPLAGSEGLREIDVSWNHLGGLVTAPLGSCPRLESISLEANQLREVSCSVCTLRNLESLKLGLNKLVALPENLGSLAKLKRLEVSNNPLHSLPESFSSLRNLEVLKIADVPLRQLPASVEGLARLLVLDASFLVREASQGALLARLLGGLRDAARVDIMHDSLREVPEELRACDGLKYLDLGSNEIAAMPGWFDSFSHLQVLGLNGYKGREFPGVILSMSQLKHLKMADSSCQFPVELLQMPSLEAVAVSQFQMEDPVLKQLAGRGVRVHVPYFRYGHFGKMRAPLWELDAT
ncbi:MAG: hypothetical protein JW839_01685 [Candidatus Lokiarchaeota archaeon]|nr:hypothetical protein [Candidatus Lokiarchaeota archaeon]